MLFTMEDFLPGTKPGGALAFPRILAHPSFHISLEHPSSLWSLRGGAAAELPGQSKRNLSPTVGIQFSGLLNLSIYNLLKCIFITYYSSLDKVFICIQMWFCLNVFIEFHLVCLLHDFA